MDLRNTAAVKSLGRCPPPLQTSPTPRVALADRYSEWPWIRSHALRLDRRFAIQTNCMQSDMFARPLARSPARLSVCLSARLQASHCPSVRPCFSCSERANAVFMFAAQRKRTQTAAPSPTSSVSSRVAAYSESERHTVRETESERKSHRKRQPCRRRQRRLRLCRCCCRCTYY